MRFTRFGLYSIFFFSIVLRAAAGAPDENWTDFRGPTCDGRVTVTGLPLNWNEQTNIKWKTPIHDRGWSTPVIQDGRIWLTTATEEGKEFFAICLNRDDGKILHDLKLFTADKPEPLGNDVNCYASPSPVSEPGRVYVHFGTYGTACLDSATGKTIWSRDDLHCRHFRGPGSSPVIYKNLLILTYDGIDNQFVVALDKATGKNVWKTNRSTDFQDLENGKPRAGGDFRKAFATPLIINTAGKAQLISVGARSAFAYEPETGKEIWKVRYPGYSNASRPVFDQGMVLLNTGYDVPEQWGVRADGTGDVTDKNIVWKYSKAVPKRSSPVVSDGLAFMAADNGIVGCVEVTTGKEIWRERLKGQFTASPLYAEGRVYFFSEHGETFVLKAAPRFEIIAESKLADGMMASPAVSGKALFLRTKTHLYRVGE